MSAPPSPTSPSPPSSPALVAHFTFACRDENNRPMAIPQLAPETDLDRQRFDERAALAEERRRGRQARAAAAAEASSALSNSRTFSSSNSKSFSISLSMPMQLPGLSGRESGLSGRGSGGVNESLGARIEAVPDLLEAAAAADLPALAAGDAIPSKLMAAGNTFMCQPQQRNITGRVFGGFLMRKAFELAFASCYVHCGFRPKLSELERVEFILPVMVGTALVLFCFRGKSTERRSRRLKNHQTTLLLFHQQATCSSFEGKCSTSLTLRRTRRPPPPPPPPRHGRPRRPRSGSGSEPTS